MPTGSNPAPHLSHTAIDTLTRCGQQYYYRYVKGIRVPPGIALLQGRAVDECVTADLTAKRETGNLLPQEQISDTAHDAFVSLWDAGEVALEEEYADLGLTGAKALGIDNSVRLAGLHHTAAAPLIAPVHLQRRWELQVKGIPYTLVGIIDIQEKLQVFQPTDAEHSGIVKSYRVAEMQWQTLVGVRDTKTSKKSPGRGVAASSQQLSAYALGVMILDGKLPDFVALDYLVSTKTPQYIPLVSRRTEAAILPFIERLYQAARVIQAGAFMPAQPDAWNCSPRWCGYWDRCPYAARPVQVSVSNRSKR